MTSPENDNVVPFEKPGESRALEERSDDELMLLCRGGRREAFEVLVRRHQRKVLRIAAKHIGSIERAQDVAQTTFVEIYRYVPRYQALGKFEHLLSRILLNQCRMAHRKERSAEKAQAVLETMPEPEAALPDDQLLARERRRTVEVAVGKLSEKLRDVVVLRFSGGLSYQAISEELDVPVGTVKSRLAAGMDKLRELLGEEAWP